MAVSGIIKPPMWNASPGLVAPEWQWYWQDLLAAWVHWEGQGGKTCDLSGNGSHLTIVGMPWVTTSIGYANDLQDDGDELSLDDKLVTIPLVSDYTYIWTGIIESHGASNAGFWRDNSNSNGANFNILQGTGGLPWIRHDNSDVLKPGSGVEVPFNEVVTIAFVIRSGSWAGFYMNGILEHEATHARVEVPIIIYQLGWEFTTPTRINGKWISHSFHTRALGSAQLFQHAQDPFGPFRMEDIAPFVTVAPPAAAIMPQMQFSNLGADLYDGALIQ